MTADDAEDRSTWPRNGQVIRRDELLRLIEENGGPEGLDLRGATLLGDAASDRPMDNPIDLRPEALVPLAESYRQDNAGREPPWLMPDGGVALWDVQLQQAYLSRAHLDRANLAGANLERAYLRHARLRSAHLTDANLNGAQLDSAQLQEAELIRVGLQDANVTDAQLQEADLWDAQLQRAVLQGAQLQRANLTGVHLHGANLLNTHLQGARLQWAQLQRVDMYGVTSLDATHWHETFLEHTRIKWGNLGDAIGDEIRARDQRAESGYRVASEAYLLLKNNFSQIGRYEDASKAYFKEQQMDKMANYCRWRSHGWHFWRAPDSLWHWLRHCVYEQLAGYGEKPWRPVRAGGLVATLFAAGFYGTRAIGNLWDAFVYSIATFATFNLARPDLNPQGRGIEIASSLEAILGISVLALVVFTVGNRMSRS